jgi:hypothetical protein
VESQKWWARWHTKQSSDSKSSTNFSPTPISSVDLVWTNSQLSMQDIFHSYLKSFPSQAKVEREYLLDADVFSSAEGGLMKTGAMMIVKGVGI